MRTAGLNLFISNFSYLEIKKSTNPLGIKNQSLSNLIHRLIVVKLKSSLKQIKSEYLEFVTDSDDAHIIAGAIESEAKFLITYNLRHYKTDLIKQKNGILVMTPALFLQYLRSRK